MPDGIQRHSPRKQEGNFQVKNNEQNGDEVVANIEFGTGVFEGFEPTFIRR
jgi:hypothetical protein